MAACAVRGSWPEPSAYSTAIQTPSRLLDPELRKSKLARSGLGMPQVSSGNFAVVYRLVHPRGTQWAVRCFQRAVDRRDARYSGIAAHLRTAACPYLVGFEYQDPGIRVDGRWYPVVKMEWVAGETLDRWVARNLADASAILALAERWRALAASLRLCGIAHGDLQHGNIMVTPAGDRRLVDYDGVFVPALRGPPSAELGHENYQHPGRSSCHFEEQIDNFSAVLIYVSLRALAHNPSLWQNGADALVLKRGDLANPDPSRAFRKLRSSGDPVVRELSAALAGCCRAAPDSAPALEDSLISIGVTGRVVVPRAQRAIGVARCSRRLRVSVLQAAGAIGPQVRVLRYRYAASFLIFLVGLGVFSAAERLPLSRAQGPLPPAPPATALRVTDSAQAAPAPIPVVPASPDPMAWSIERSPPAPVSNTPVDSLVGPTAPSLDPDTKAGTLEPKPANTHRPNTSPWDRGLALDYRDSLGMGAAEIRSVTVSPDGTIVAAAQGDVVRLWNQEDMSLLGEVQGHRGEVLALAFSPDGTVLASGSEDGSVLLTGTDSAGVPHRLVHGSTVLSLAYSPDGRRLLVGCADGNATLYDVPGRARIRRSACGGSVYSLAFSPHGDLVAAGTGTGLIALLEAVNGDRVLSLGAHGGWVLSVACSPDGSMLASGGRDDTVRMFSRLQGWRLDWVSAGFGGWAEPVASTPDGRCVAASGADGRILLDGRLRLTMDVKWTYSVEKWIRGFGEDVEVVKPKPG